MQESRPFLSKATRSLLAILYAAVLVVLAVVLLNAGFNELRKLRQLERTPHSLVAGVLPGEVQLRGVARSAGELLTAPHTRTPTLYYHYHVERRTYNAQRSRTHWSTVSSESRRQPFWLEDESGRIRVEVSARANFRAQTRLSQIVGDLRYTETRIDPGDEVSVFAHAERRGETMVVGFDVEGQYVPLVSNQDEATSRENSADYLLLVIWLGLLFVSFAVYWACRVMRVHRTAVFLGVLGAAMALPMAVLSVITARDDLQTAYARSARDAQQARALIAERLSAAGLHWDGDWSTLGDINAPQRAALAPEQRRILTHVRARTAAQIARTLEVRRQWPERLVAPILSLPELPQIPLPGAPGAEATMAPPRVGALVISKLAIGSLVLAILLAWLGFRRLRVKWRMESASRRPGVTEGMVKLAGVAQLGPSEAPLKGPLSGRDCVWFHYKVTDRRVGGLGRRSRLETLEDRGSDRRFWLENSTGRVAVDPQQAETMVACENFKSEGLKMFIETRIEPGAAVFVLGSAQREPGTGGSLVVARGPKDQPFLISDLPEAEVMLRKARGGFLWLTFAVIAGNAAALSVLGASGALHGLGLLLAALAPLGFIAGLLALQTYDLARRRQHVRPG